VLRMIRFNAMVCHLHRCVLAIMETYSEQRGPRWHGHGVAPSGRVLSCAAILLAAAMGGPGGSGDGGSVAVNNNYAPRMAGNKDDGNAPMTMLPNFWWRVLDVSMEDITIVRDELRKEYLGRGGRCA
jgi:hypothetical protein